MSSDRFATSPSRRSFATPFDPVAIVCIAVSFYLGFQSNQAYNRWWEARTIWGAIINDSRSWAHAALTLTRDADGNPLDCETQKLAIHRHIAWVNALAFQLRKVLKIIRVDQSRIFDHAVAVEGTQFARTHDDYLSHLSEGERVPIQEFTNPAVHILISRVLSRMNSNYLISACWKRRSTCLLSFRPR